MDRHGIERGSDARYVGTVGEVVVAVDDPRAADVQALIEAHLTFAHEHTPPEDVHALDVDRLVDERITFFSVREDGRLLGVGALRELDPRHGELKSMHTTVAARRRGVGRAIVVHLLHEARRRGMTRVSLETGTMAAFAPSRALYASLGFEVCEPFGEHTAGPSSVCMTRLVDPVPPPGG